MAKPIYCSLLLLVLCLTHDAYGHRRLVRHTRIPSHTISNNNGPYDSSSSSSSLSTADAALADEEETSKSAATSLSSSPPPRKSFTSNNSFGFDGNRRLGQNSKTRRGLHYTSKPSDVDLEDSNILDSEKKNSMTSGFIKNEPQSDRYYRNNQNDITSENLNIAEKRQNSKTPGVKNISPQRGSYNRNYQNYRVLEDPNTSKIQNSMNSDFQDFPRFSNFPNLPKTKMTPFAGRIPQQKTLSQSSNVDNSRQISVGYDNLSMINSFKSPSNDRRSNMQNMISFKSVRNCCINGNCRVLQEGEECGIKDFFANMKKTQQPNSPMFITSSNGNDDFHAIMSKLMDAKFKPHGQNSFNSFRGDSADSGDSDDFQETVGSNDGMDPYVNMPQEREPINYPKSDPIGLSEDEANEIRAKVLKKSNFYREKIYRFDPFTLDDQLNNCAQDWANELAKSQTLDHRPDNVYGENLFSSSDSNNLGENAVNDWYNEITKFTINGEESELGSNVETHHMTQLLWKASKKLGVGVSKNANGMYNVVANYEPSGNVHDSFKKNLPEIKQENIDNAIESQNQLVNSKPEMSWSSSQLQSGWDDDSY